MRGLVGTANWKVVDTAYDPVAYTSASVMREPPWADPLLPVAQWNAMDRNVNRKSFMGPYYVVDHLPLNPMGRTGICGRGLLGRYGPNHAAGHFFLRLAMQVLPDPLTHPPYLFVFYLDPIVTRWRDTADGNRVLQFVCVTRKDNGQRAIPGGMVEPGATVSATIAAEFGEEALNKLDITDAAQVVMLDLLDDLFAEGVEIYTGYVDDPRNTDNAWMETTVLHVHDDTGAIFSKFPLSAGDDAASVFWLDITADMGDLYANHRVFIDAAAARVKDHP